MSDSGISGGIAAMAIGSLASGYLAAGAALVGLALAAWGVWRFGLARGLKRVSLHLYALAEGIDAGLVKRAEVFEKWEETDGR